LAAFIVSVLTNQLIALEGALGQILKILKKYSDETCFGQAKIELVRLGIFPEIETCRERYNSNRMARVCGFEQLLNGLDYITKSLEAGLAHESGEFGAAASDLTLSHSTTAYLRGCVQRDRRGLNPRSEYRNPKQGPIPNFQMETTAAARPL
jgi:hypothetical protein